MRDVGDTGWRRGLLAVLLVAAALRLYPIWHRHPGLEMQEHFPRNAVQDFVEGTWRPYGLHHGGGIVVVLRAIDTVWYATGRLLGLYHERVDLLAAYLRDWLPFAMVGRVLVTAAGIATVALVARLGALLDGRAAGLAAALLVAVSPSHVRESHQVWVDVPAGALGLAAVLAALRALEGGRLATLAVAGALGGATIGFRHSSFPIALPVALAAVLAGPMQRRALASRLAAAGLPAFAAFALLSPYAIIAAGDTARLLAVQSAITFSPDGRGIRLPALVRLGLGPVLPALAVIGLAVAARARPRAAAVAAAFPLAYAAVLAPSTMLYARYLALLVPWAALFGGIGAVRVGALVARRAPLAAAALLTVAVAAEPAWQSVGWVRLLGRDDTRDLAGAWICAHVPPGTQLLLPNAVPYPNPTLPIDRQRLQFTYPQQAPALLARGIAAPDRTYPALYARFFGKDGFGAGPLPHWVVTSTHPVVTPEMHTPPRLLQRLHDAGARPVAVFAGAPDPLPPGVVFDPLDADYLPLRGAWRLERPGPTITVWEVPPP